jgi:enoyl-CoA hydratase/carnithine racemase
MVTEFETISYRVEEGVAWVTLDRPDALNAFNTQMQQELRSVWRGLRADPDARCAVLTGAGDRAFCTGIDRMEAIGSAPEERTVGSRGTPFHFDDPGDLIGPKSNDLWKPVIAAINGMACGGAFYMLGEVDVIIATDDATFFDPHLTYGMAAVFESIHMLQKMPLGEVLRMQLMGSHERLSAQRALQIGLVSEVVPRAELLEAAGRVAGAIASQPTLAVQATLRSIWTAHELSRSQALEQGFAYIATGTDQNSINEGQQAFTSGQRVEWRLR